MRIDGHKFYGAASCAVATVCYGQSSRDLGRTFASFKACAVPLHAFVIGEQPKDSERVPGIVYHECKPSGDLFHHPLREVYYRRLELMEECGADYVLMVDSYDAYCLQPLPAFDWLLGDADVAGVTEHMAARYLSHGYTGNFINCGVTLWNVKGSAGIRCAIVSRGLSKFRRKADDQESFNEVLNTMPDRLRILPWQYNCRAFLNRAEPGWPTIDNLDGVYVYHNGACIAEAKALAAQKQAALQPLTDTPDTAPLSEWAMAQRAAEERARGKVIGAKRSWVDRLCARVIGL